MVVATFVVVLTVVVATLTGALTVFLAAFFNFFPNPSSLLVYPLFNSSSSSNAKTLLPVTFLMLQLNLE